MGRSGEDPARSQHLGSDVIVRTAGAADVPGIYSVARSVGSAVNQPDRGFLLADYAEQPERHMAFFADRVQRLEHFRVAEQRGNILGFIVAYRGEEWLLEEPRWLGEVAWHPGFTPAAVTDFVMIDKVAVHADGTGRGIGTVMHENLLECLRDERIDDVFQEAVIDPTPNLASLAYKHKQDFSMAGIRYDEHDGTQHAVLVYHKAVDPSG